MKDNAIIKSKIRLRYFYDDIFFERNNIILDKNFKTLASNPINDKPLWITLAACSIIVAITFLGALNTLQSSKNKLGKHLQLNLESLSPTNVQILSSLSSTKYFRFIQNVYIKPNADNELVILIKPSLWNILQKGEKQDILSKTEEKWSEIYKKQNPDSKKKVAVSFANRN